MIRTGTGRDAEGDAVAGVAVREGMARGNAQYDYETYGYRLPARDLDCSGIRTTGMYAESDTVADVAVREGTARGNALYPTLPRDLDYSGIRTTAKSTVRSRASGVQDSAGARAQRSSGSSRGMLPPRNLTSAGIRSAAKLTARSRASGVQELAEARAQRSSESTRVTVSAQVLTSAGTRSAEAEETARVEDVMTMLTHVATVTGLKAAYTHSRRATMVTAPFIFAGAALLGPPGIFIGGTVGSFIAWMVSEDFKSVPQILMELPAAERQKLCAEAMAALKNFDWTDAAQLTNLVLSNSTIEGEVLRVLTTYITNNLKAKPKYKK